MPKALGASGSRKSAMQPGAWQPSTSISCFVQVAASAVSTEEGSMPPGGSHGMLPS